MKRCLVGWRDGTLGFKAKMCASDIAKLTNAILRTKLPSEIHRSLRGMDCLAFWKGSEWRAFLNYVGIVVLKDYLSSHVYNHFLVLFVAVTICSCSIYTEYLSLAQHMFECYIIEFKNIYGAECVTSNVHNLEHIVGDVIRFGPLPSISSYPFENALFQIKRQLRHGQNSLEQVANRITEKSSLPLKIQHAEYPAIKRIGNIVQCYIKSDFFLSTNFKNSWFLTKTKEIARMTSACMDENRKIIITARLVQKPELFFPKPIRSSYLHIYKVNKLYFNSENSYKLDDVFCKLVAIRYKGNEFEFTPLQHTLPKVK
ncbi:uncharacterized protein LOC129728906 [Wyeomyia smithii]|uniref:uncharacterized protein LOC129728906 n=1 Tax=Wyeomyia smithii TaxID=174621 RepID=UPI002467B391|nr:uncharacterized protein LOC129728906 [Wyeomyia smithii]